MHPEKLPKQIHYDYSNTSDNDVTDDDLDDTNDTYDNSDNDSQNLSAWEDRDYVRRNRQGISDAEWDAMTPYEKQLADQEYEQYYR